MGLSEIFVIFVESAALHTYAVLVSHFLAAQRILTPLRSWLGSSWIFFFLVSYIAASPLETFAFHCIPATTGISFMLIIVRVGLGLSWAERSGSPAHVAAGAQARNFNLNVDLDQGAACPLTILSLHVTRTVEREAVTDFALPRVGNKGDADSDGAQDAGESV